MTTAIEMRDELKDAFRVFGQTAARFIDNETGQIPEEYKEHVKDMVRIQIKSAIENDEEFLSILYRTLMNENRPSGESLSPKAWFEERVENALDEIMCQKTRDTIEEYNLISYDSMQEQIAEYDFSGHTDSMMETIEENIVSGSTLDNYCNEYMQENVKTHIDFMIEEGDLTNLSNPLQNMTESERAAILKPVIQETLEELLNNDSSHPMFKEVVKSALKEVLQDVLRG